MRTTAALVEESTETMQFPYRYRTNTPGLPNFCYGAFTATAVCCIAKYHAAGAQRGVILSCGGL